MICRIYKMRPCVRKLPLKNQLDRESHRPRPTETVERRKTTACKTPPAHRRRLPNERGSQNEIVPQRIFEVRMIENIERVCLELQSNVFTKIELPSQRHVYLVKRKAS